MTIESSRHAVPGHIGYRSLIKRAKAVKVVKNIVYVHHAGAQNDDGTHRIAKVEFATSKDAKRSAGSLIAAIHKYEGMGQLGSDDRYNQLIEAYLNQVAEKIEKTNEELLDAETEKVRSI